MTVRRTCGYLMKQRRATEISRMNEGKQHKIWSAGSVSLCINKQLTDKPEEAEEHDNLR